MLQPNKPRKGKGPQLSSVTPLVSGAGMRMRPLQHADMPPDMVPGPSMTHPPTASTVPTEQLQPHTPTDMSAATAHTVPTVQLQPHVYTHMSAAKAYTHGAHCAATATYMHMSAATAPSVCTQPFNDMCRAH